MFLCLKLCTLELVFLEEAFLDMGTEAQGVWAFKAAISLASYSS